MAAASALGRDASILSPLSQAFERTRLERADRTGAHACFALAERSSEEPVLRSWWSSLARVSRIAIYTLACVEEEHSAGW
jgi:hypothetical protein